jgi:hypothetical protein
VADEQPKRPFMVWNGEKISDPALLPPHLRPLLEDLDGDGIPDLAQQGPGQRPIIYNDKLYRNLDEVPPELRAEVEAAMAEAEGANTGVPVETTTVRIRQSPGSDAPTEIEVGGHSYTSIDQVPAEHRALVERAMNAVPALPPEIEINGRRHTSIDEVPEEYRALVRQALTSSPGLAAGPATVPASGAGQKLCGRSAAEAPRPQGATRAHSGPMQPRSNAAAGDGSAAQSLSRRRPRRVNLPATMLPFL